MKYGKILFFAIFLICLALIICLPVSADSDNVSIVKSMGKYSVEYSQAHILNGFGETNEGFDVENGSSYVTVRESIDVFPYEPLTDGGSLVYRDGEGGEVSNRYISRKYQTPLDLSENAYIVIPVNCMAVKGSEYVFTLEFKSGKNTFSASAEIEAERWNGVFVDISAFESKDKIDTLRMAVTPSQKTEGFEYCIDSIMVSENTDIVNRFTFSADRYVCSAGDVLTERGRMEFIPHSESFYVDSVGFAYKNLKGANCLRVDFDTESNCMGVGITLYDELGQTVGTRYVKTEKQGSEYTAYLPTDFEKTDRIRLSFDLLERKLVDIKSIVPYSAVLGEQQNDGIETCVVNPTTKEIIIRGGMGRTYTGGEIYLFANDMCDVITPESLEKYQSIAKTDMVSRDFIFRIKYGENDDPRGCVYKKYTVALKDENGYEVIGTPKCITNPEGFAEATDELPKKRSGKGVYGKSVSFMQEMGVTDTAVWVDIGKFFALGAESEEKFECGGDLYYYNRGYANGIDEEIKAYSEKGIGVTLVFVVSDTGSGLNSALIHPDAKLDAKYCAYNATDRVGIRYLRAVCEYFASKYGADLSVDRVVFGDSVGSFDSYNMGSKTLADFCEQYALALRIVYAAFKSYSQYTQVYTYIDGNWDYGLSYDSRERYDNRAFVDSLDAGVERYGDISWGIALDPYPHGDKEYISYRDDSLENNIRTDRISFKNIRVLKDYLEREYLQYNDSARNLIIIEKADAREFDEMTETADYVYNCYTALNGLVSAYITNRSCNYNNAMKYVDTSLSMTASNFAPDVLGVSSWYGVIDGFSEDNVIKVPITRDEIMFAQPEYKGSVVLSDFSKGSGGWRRYGFDERLTSGMSLLGKEGLLSLSLGTIPQGEKRGIVKRYDVPCDLTNTPVLRFSINIASLPTGVDSAEIYVVAISDNAVYEASGRVKGAVWTNVCCDLTGFDGIDSIDEIRVLIGAKDLDFEDTQALISSVEGLSYELDSEQLMQAIDSAEQNGYTFESIKKYVIPALFVIIVCASAWFVTRRLAK